MMELRGWQIAFAGMENFILINTALSVVAFIVAYLLRRSGRSELMESWHPDAKARVYIAALAVPPALSAWLVCASLFPALWLGEELWAREHTDKHSLHLLNAFTVSADPMLGYVAMIFTLLALLVATCAAWRAYFRINRLVGCLEIVGIAGEVKQRSLNEPPQPFLHLPLLQDYRSNMILVARTALELRAALPAVESVVATLDQNMPIFDVKTLNEHIGLSLFLPRMAATLLSLFGLLALFIAGGDRTLRRDVVI